jgi:hypothetical protein
MLADSSTLEAVGTSEVELSLLDPGLKKSNPNGSNYFSGN